MIDEDKLDSIRDLIKFASTFLTIRSKSGRPDLFKCNQAQLYLHNRLQTQLKETGKVRAIVLKGRQQGCSTYIQARFFHRVITTRGKKAFILTHEAEATKNLFEMTKRFADNLDEGLTYAPDRSSAKELRFLELDSGYSVGTAGNKGAGRSLTIQLFHGSETAYWPGAEEHAKGVLQAISNEAGTEIILESTANGIGNYFHSVWKSALTGSSDYQAIFLPWYWQTEYRLMMPGFKMDEEEQELHKIYEKDGITEEHLAWRRVKISEFSSDYETGLELFKSEYPLNAEEAFRNPIQNVFINARHVMRARCADVDSEAGLVIGVDVAIGENDRTAIIRRRGRLAFGLEIFRNLNTMEIAGKIRRIIDQETPAWVFIDCIGIGAGVVDRLREMGFENVIGVNVARSANEKDKFKNVRAELWSDMRDWLAQEMPVQIPDSDELHGELCSLGFKYNSNGQLQIESKDDLRARGMPSPDCADAFSLTFYIGDYANTDNFALKVIPKIHQNQFM